MAVFLMELKRPIATTVRFLVSLNIVHTLPIIIQSASNTMSFGILSGLQPTEEERKKKRDQFNSNMGNYGFGDKSNQDGLFGGSNKLTNQIKQEQKQGALTRTPAQARVQESGLEQQRQRAQQRTQTEADRQQRARDFAIVKQEVQAVARMPVKEQVKAVEQLKAKAQARAQGNSAPPVTAPVAVKPSPVIGGIDPNKFRAANANKPAAPALGMVGNPNAGKPANNNVSDKTIADSYADIGTIGSEPIWKGNPDNKSFGLSITPTPDKDPLSDFAKATATQSNLGFRMPSAPTRSWSERQEREALLRDASTVYKGSQNGQLTSSQMQLRAGILGADDKSRNDQYNAQLGVASQMAQTQATQGGANARAALSEMGSSNRLNDQLGFDADKFKLTSDQQDQKNAIDNRRLDIQQSNDDVQNYSAKNMNNLYQKYQAAETDEQKSEVAAQIRALKGTSEASDNEYWTNIGGGETLSTDGLTSTKNPDILLNRNTGETRAIPRAPIDYENDPRAIAIRDDTSLSKKDRMKLLEALV